MFFPVIALVAVHSSQMMHIQGFDSCHVGDTVIAAIGVMPCVIEAFRQREPIRVNLRIGSLF